jgi:hypothetical protein
MVRQPILNGDPRRAKDLFLSDAGHTNEDAGPAPPKGDPRTLTAVRTGTYRW